MKKLITLLLVLGTLNIYSQDQFIYDSEEYNTESVITHKIKNYTENEFQIGFAPYIGEYNDLHTWIMLKTKKDTLNNIWETYPFVKFFKGDVLIEIGYKSSHWNVHYMMRF